MSSFEDELRMDEEENRREVNFIREQLPMDVKEIFLFLSFQMCKRKALVLPLSVILP